MTDGTVNKLSGAVTQTDYIDIEKYLTCPAAAQAIEHTAVSKDIDFC